MGSGLVIAWGAVGHIAKTWAWRLILLDDKVKFSFARMLGLRARLRSSGSTGRLGQLAGEGLRVSMLVPTIPLTSGITSQMIDRAFFVLSAAVVSIVGLLAVHSSCRCPHTLALYAGPIRIHAPGIRDADCGRSQKPLAGAFGDSTDCRRSGIFKDWVESKRSVILSIENSLLDFYHRTAGFVLGQFRAQSRVPCAARSAKFI